MRKTSYGLVDADNINEVITVDMKGLQTLTSLGRCSARSVAEEAGAVVRIGTRTVFLVDKIRTYMHSLAE